MPKKTFLKEVGFPHSFSFMHITIFFFLQNINKKLDINASYKFWLFWWYKNQNAYLAGYACG